jgi:hypothetical protein
MPMPATSASMPMPRYDVESTPHTSTVPEFIDPVLGVKMIVFAKLSPKRSFSFQSVLRDAGLRLFWMRSD